MWDTLFDLLIPTTRVGWAVVALFAVPALAALLLIGAMLS